MTDTDYLKFIRRLQEILEDKKFDIKERLDNAAKEFLKLSHEDQMDLLLKFVYSEW